LILKLCFIKKRATNNIQLKDEILFSSGNEALGTVIPACLQLAGASWNQGVLERVEKCVGVLFTPPFTVGVESEKVLALA